MANYLDYYIIPLNGLREGKHDFSFEVDEKFFEQYEHSEVKRGNLKVSLTLTKRDSAMFLNFVILGSVNITCDRCLNLFDLPININEKITIKFGESVEDSSFIGEDDQIIARDESHLSIAQFLYEFIELNIPYKRVHANKENGEQGCEVEFLEEEIIPEKNEIIDPRWNKLKEIL